MPGYTGLMAHQVNDESDAPSDGRSPRSDEASSEELTVSEKVKRGVKITVPEPVPGGTKLEQ